ncbi:MAG: hypothetical protein ABSA92_11485 [Candidatus Bathyarchaeia archaeon]
MHRSHIVARRFRSNLIASNGHASRQSPHPLQSSGSTYTMPVVSFLRIAWVGQADWHSGLPQCLQKWGENEHSGSLRPILIRAEFRSNLPTLRNEQATAQVWQPVQILGFAIRFPNLGIK